MRLQLALNVKNLDHAIAFYSEMFASPVHKQRPGYANFEIENPPLKLVLFEHPTATENLNHIGIECLTEQAFDTASDRLHQSNLVTSDTAETGCCHAKQSKFWATGPDGLAWEWYRILDDAPHEQTTDQTSPGATCCGQQPDKTTNPDQVCCA
ncbi:glyoxalase/bleomycin resistance/extradiol dioxygenase family protein [Thalassospira sp. HF15]|uniref:ArsI/CadI family heavy metal resistance metalloenzyme n=1 Tax=Thalassospira sp. HF15 TaxID=2722755 RepID=UPI0014316F4D|nr:ArsI/CadI family heavy metal resistance metalloenzyme [Thalassospira sp. HF15]NIY74723.1 glyoxalase/bleomycin resistance/extradiol dioxygenase family protein [Thalassospira sp. HF15]